MAIGKSPSQEKPAMSLLDRRAHVRAVARTAAICVVVSELITLVMLEVLLGYILVEGLVIALICSGPLGAWIADRQLRMGSLIAHQRDQLSVLNQELNERNADLDAFARAVAHDLKNPLSVVIGLAHTLVSDPDLPADDEIAELLHLIAQSGDRAAEIIDGLLLLHGIQQVSQEFTQVDTDRTVDTALETMAKTMEDKNAVVTRAGPLPSVRAHGPWLALVWTNLIGNALKHGGSPPAVELAAHPAPDGMVRFEVRDNGVGVAPSDRDRIFSEFQRGANTQVEGHGLGLAIVDRVVDRLGGDIGMDEATGGGSVFWFTVPAA